MANRTSAYTTVPRTPWPLPLDVLIEILVFSEGREVSKVMRTCRTLYHEGGKVLARKGAWLDTLQRVSSFTDFMEAEGRSRCQHLSHLSIVMRYPDDPLIYWVGHPLARLLRQGSFRSLCRLYLDSADLIFEHTPELIAAFAALLSLEHIELEGCGVLAATFLKGLKSKPTLVELTYDGMTNEEEPSARNESHPIVALQSVRESLQRLYVTQLDSPLDPSNLSLEPLANLEELVLDRTERPILEPYIRFCPNMKYLDITTVYHCMRIWCEDDIDMDELDDLRSINVECQRQHGTWSGLESVSGSIYDIYLAALACPIEELFMRFGRFDRFDPIIPIVSTAKVSSLTLWTANHYVFDNEEGLPSVLGVLGEASPGLQELELAIHVKYSEEDLESAFERIFRPVSSLPIRRFEMELYLKETSDVLGSPVDRFLADLDFTRCAQDVLADSATLKEVKIGIYAHPTRGNVAACAVRG